jgi:hypothetical protein
MEWEVRCVVVGGIGIIITPFFPLPPSSFLPINLAIILLSLTRNSLPPSSTTTVGSE